MSETLENTPTLTNGLTSVGAPDPYMGEQAPVVFKLGSMTGGTAGIFNGAKAFVKLGYWDKRKKQSRELMFIGGECQAVDENRHFSLPGDSGGWVFDDLGNWLGVIVAGEKFDADKPVSQHVTYVIPAKDIVNDIVDVFKEAGHDIVVELS